MKKLLMGFVGLCLSLMPLMGWAQEAYAIITEWNDSESNYEPTLTFYFDDQKEARMGSSWDGYAYSLNDVGETPEWIWMNSDYIEWCVLWDITKVVFDSSFANARPVSTWGWFSELGGLNTIEGLEYLNTSEVRDMGYMFNGCYSLDSLDLSHFDTSKVTNMESMFCGCSSLDCIDLSHFNTSNVANMNSMFGACSGLTSLDVSGFNTANVIDMGWMFAYCTSLTSLDLNSFNTSKVKSLYGLFSGCTSLKNLKYSNFDTSNATSMEYMFSGCSSFTTIPLTHLNTAKVTNFSNMFSNCTGLTEIDLSSFNTAKGTTFSSMFKDCYNLRNVDLAHFDTSNATNMSYMFSGCNSLDRLDLTHFNTSKVTSMQSMFFACSGLTSIDLSSFNTEKVYDMGNMFKECSRLTALNLGGFKTPKLTTVNNMFEGCARLLSLDLSNFTIDLAYSSRSTKMLYGCGSLATLALPNAMNALSDDACLGVGSDFKPCLLAVPEGFDFGIDDTSGCFEWKSGYFSLQAYTDLNNYDDVIYVDNARLVKGAQGVLSVKMNNTTAVRGFQFDLVLPNGVSVTESADGKLMVELSTARANPNNFDMFTSVRQTDGSVRVFCLSAMNPTAFSGNSGEVCRVHVIADESMAEGDYFVKLKNVVYTDDAANKYTIEGEVVTKLTVDDVAMGDANGDGSIDVADVAVLANIILGKNAANVVPSALDMNGDGSVDVADLAAICNIILHGSASAPARAKNANSSSSVQMGVRPLSLCAGDTAELELTLDNAMDDVCSWQTDLNLPDGIHVVGVRLSDSRKVDQVVEWQALSGGVSRLLCFSMTNKLLLGKEGTVALVKVKVDENMPAGVYGIGLGHSILTDGHNRMMAADGGAVMTVNGPTGVNDLTNQNGHAVGLYGVGGERIGTTQRGISIIKMPDGTIRKVTTK